ncbi:MAG: hypothetical protein NT042_15390 [Sulfuritalea sp.]|nr:hypothetical protein [Sulfuritalea sp.]
MSWKEAIPAALSVVSAMGKADAGDAAARVGLQQQAAAQYEAEQLRINAGQSIASAQRAAEEQRRQGMMIQSRAIALAAAGGGSVTDPGLVHLLAGNAGETAYRSAVALYEGEDKARTMRESATAAEYSGAAAAQAGADRQKAAMTLAFGDLIGGGGSKGGDSLYKILNPKKAESNFGNGVIGLME